MKVLISLFFVVSSFWSVFSQVEPISYSKFLCPDEIYKNQMICLNERLSVSNCSYTAPLPAYNNFNDPNTVGIATCPGVCCWNNASTGGYSDKPDNPVNTTAYYNLDLKCINSPNKVAITKIDDYCWSVVYLDTGTFLFNIDINVRNGREISGYYCEDTTWINSCGQDRTWKQITVFVGSNYSCNEYANGTCNLIQNGSFEDYTTCPSSNSVVQNMSFLNDWENISPGVPNTTSAYYPFSLCANYISHTYQAGFVVNTFPPQPFPSGDGYLFMLQNSKIGQFINLCTDQKYRFSLYSMRGGIFPNQDIVLSGINTSSFPSSNALTGLTNIQANEVNQYYSWRQFTQDFIAPTNFNGIAIEGLAYFDDISIVPIDTVEFNTQLITNRCDSAEMILTIPGCYGPYNLDVVVNNDTLNFLQVQDGHTIRIPLAQNNVVTVLSITNSLGCATVLNTSDTIVVNNSGNADFYSNDFCEGQTNILTFLADTGVFSLVNNTSTASIDPNTGIITGATGNNTFIICHAVCLDTVYDTINVYSNSAAFTSTNLCAGGTNVVTITGATGGSFALLPPTYGATIDSNTGVISGSTTGNTYSIEYSVGSICASSSIQNIQALITEDASFNIPDFCTTTTNIVNITGTTGGSFSFTPIPNDGATIDSLTGIISGAVTGATYSVKYVTPGSCNDSSLKTVTVLDFPTATINSSGGDLCVDDSIAITVNLTGTPPWDIVYSNGISSFTENNITTSPFTIYAKTRGQFRISAITDSLCTNGLGSTNFITIDGGIVSFWSNIADGCAPQEVTFMTNLNGLNGDCIWNFGDGNSINSCGTVFHTYQNPGVYSVKLTVSSAKCSGDTIINDLVTIHNNPTASFYYTPQKPSVLQNTISFINNSTDNSFNEWYLNSSFNTILVDPQITLPPVVSSNEVCLVVENRHGCLDTTCSDISLFDESLFYIPNAFIPNNDGLNDVFKPIASNVSLYNLEIFNRWGELLFESTDLNKGWNGIYDGAMSKTGVYVYRIKYRLKGNFDDQYIKGSFSLLK